MSMNYDILIASSINRLNSNIVKSLQAVSATAPRDLVSPPASMQPHSPVQSPPIKAASFRHQRGLTLVELMIAMLLGLFLLGGILQIFISSRHTYTMQEGLSRLQENGRFAIDFMARDIRLAGYVGCPDSQALLSMQNMLNNPTAFLYRFNTGIEGFEATSAPGVTPGSWSPSIINAAITSPWGGADVITIRRADEQGVLVAGQDPGLFTLTLAQPATLNKCDIAVVASCQTAAVFQVSDIPTNNVLEYKPGTSCNSGASTVAPGNDAAKFLGNYASGDVRLKGEVRLMNTISYYVRRSDVTNELSLYRRIGENDAQELVEGVERMEILYGVDTDTDENAPGYGSANYYVKADANTLDVPGNAAATAANWAKVVSVRISLLVATVDEIASQPLAYTFNDELHDGATFPLPTDRKLRRAFTTTIALRNRVP